MPIRQPTAQVKEEIVAFIKNLLELGTEIEPALKTQISAKWNKENLKIKATIYHLLPLLPIEESIYDTKQKVSHLRYILIHILQKQLKILTDHRLENSPIRKLQGIREWVFTLKLWYPPTDPDYVSLNLSAFEQHWNTTYKISSPVSPPRHNLPQRRHTKFIGHKAELDSLFKQLTQSQQQLFSIEGMAGVGKTTLALEIAYGFKERSDFAAIIFSSAQSEQFLGSHLTRRFLAERNLQDIFQVISRTLNRLDELPAQLEDQIRCIYEMLAEQPILLILDNIENAANQTDTIAFLSDLPPTVKVIMTSRVRLGIGQVINLNPLPSQESAELIHHRAKAQNLDIQPEQLRLIWQSTRGLPLAITYLVGSLAHGGFNLSDELPPLANSDLALFCFAQSISQLRSIPNSSAYLILLSLSLFTDGASTAAVAYVTQIDPEGDELHTGLQQLHRTSLAFCVVPKRYNLHSLTREYVQSELNTQSEIAPTLHRRWQDWYTELLSAFKTLDWQDWHDYSALDAEWKNIRSVVDGYIAQEKYEDAVELWSCLKGYTLLGGKWQQRLNWLELLLRMAINRDDLATCVELKFHQSVTFAFIDETDSQGKAIQLALETWDQHHNLSRAIQFDLAMYIAALYIRKQSYPQDQADHFQSAKIWLERGKQILEHNSTEPSPPHFFQLYYYQAELEFRSGQQNQAYHNYIQAEKLAKKAKCQRFSYYASGRIGLILAERGQLTEAEKYLQKLLQATEKYHDLRAGNICRFMLANVKKQQGNWKIAQEYAQQAKSRFMRLNMRREMDQVDHFLQSLESDSSSHKQSKSSPGVG